MCYPATCKTCGKTTWAGCGQHIADVRRVVAANKWCPGHEDAAPSRGFLSRLFGR
ncbi:hypothetical protein [Isoptericola cucumis]|uniref:Uncharacterized protein n=1 Tax=Isoptericola cucumis TaxID=1776856 RepID=A0ABQ2BAG5_9MICO|nr:hypothetical protein [Isoptericola cucumis]GGI11857.1 hypothetical protein GCM10007368_38280 [Isoptericola cucumis]